MSTYPFLSPGTIESMTPYGSLTLTETSPQQSFTEPISLQEIKSYLKIPERGPVDDSDEEAELRVMIGAAREQAEILQGRDLVRKQWDLLYDYWPSYRIAMRTPLISVDQVQYRDSDGNYTNIATDGFVLDLYKGSGIITPPYNQTWPTFTPWPSSAILIRFTSGYSLDHPWWAGSGARVKIGMKLLISHWYNSRLPFEKGITEASEYPYTVTSCLTYGSLVRAR